MSSAKGPEREEALQRAGFENLSHKHVKFTTSTCSLWCVFHVLKEFKSFAIQLREFLRIVFNNVQRNSSCENDWALEIIISSTDL
jgi:hypothetical protein